MGYLVLQNEGIDGLRYYLDGQPLHAGDQVEAKLDGDNWISVRYEYDYDPNIRTATPHIYTGDNLIPDPTSVFLRWPCKKSL